MVVINNISGQKDNMVRNPFIVPKIFLDDILKKNDLWVYIYNFLYYFIFGFILVTIPNYKHFAVIIIGALILMTGLSIIWYIIPNKTPKNENRQIFFIKNTKNR